MPEEKSTDLRIELQLAEKAREAAQEEVRGLRADIAFVRGHLEGYADSIEAFGVNGNAGEEKLWRALREDSEKLEQSVGKGDTELS
jgi:hypothetical protein